MENKAGKTNELAAAFSLVELLVAVSIIALLAGLLLPSFGRLKEITRRAVCVQNLHTLGTGWGLYLTQTQNHVPPLENNLDRDTTASNAFYMFCRLNGPRGWVGSGWLYEQRLVSDGRAYVCPTYESNFGHPWFGNANGGWVITSPNPWPVIPGFHSKPTYSIRRARAYDDPEIRAICQSPYNPGADLPNTAMKKFGDTLLVVRGMAFIQSPSSFSYMMDGCVQNYMIVNYGHAARRDNALMANVLYMDGHVAPFVDLDGNVLSNNGIGSGGSAVNWESDRMWMSVDEHTLGGRTGN